MSIPYRTWEQVAKDYSEKNPNDPIGPKRAAIIGNSALSKIRHLLPNSPDVEEDLISLLRRAKSD